MWNKKTFQAGIAGIALATTSINVLADTNVVGPLDDTSWLGSSFYGVETNGGWNIGWDAVTELIALPQALQVEYTGPGGTGLNSLLTIPGSGPDPFLTTIEANPANVADKRFAVFQVIENAGNVAWTDWHMYVDPRFSWVDTLFTVVAAGGQLLPTPVMYDVPSLDPAASAFANGIISDVPLSGGGTHVGGRLDFFFGGTPVNPGDQIGIASVMEYSLATDWNVDPNIGMVIGLEQYATVPVPAAVWLFGSGLLGLAGIARRKVS